MSEQDDMPSIEGETEQPDEPPPALDVLAEAGARAGLTPEIVDAIAGWIATQLEHDRYARLEQAGDSVEGKIPLARVFVDLEVSDTPHGPVPERSDASAGFIRTVLGLRPHRLTEAIGLGRNTPLAIDKACPNAPEPFVDGATGNAPRTAGFVLIGGPGQGKSTLGQFLCQIHRAWLLRPRTSPLSDAACEAVEAFSGQRACASLGFPIEVCFPIRVVLSELASWLVKNSGAQRQEDAEGGTATLMSYLIMKMHESGCAVSVEELERLLAACPWLLVLDGLDEVPASSDRELMLRAVRELLQHLAARGDRGFIVATTRPQGYSGELESLGPRLEERYLIPLSIERALDYADRLAEVRFAEPPERRKRIMDRLRQASTEEATARLMRSPLQVTIMATLVDRIGRAPSERWNLFRDYYRVIYEREMERPIETAELLRSYRGHIDKIHANVGLLFQVEAERSGGTESLMSAERLGQVVDAVLAEDDIDKAKREELTRKVIEAARTRLVFLVEPQTGRYGFEIRSLQEFMAAWALSSAGDAMVEARLAQVAKSASFRNVVLFVASKCFTEISHLRDMFTERLCPRMNADPEDEIARTVLAGSVLALEILEEGSALNQPKHAKRLMELAVQLLDLPPSTFHVRIARVCSADLEPLLRTAITTRFELDEARKQLGAWVSLIALLDKGIDWARELAEAQWPADGQMSRDIVSAVRAANHPLQPWLLARIADALEAFSPEFMLPVLQLGRVHKQIGMFAWLTGLLGISRQAAPRWFDLKVVEYELPVDFGVLPLSSPSTKYWSLFQKASRGGAIGSWRHLIEASQFVLNPCAATLARELERLALEYDEDAIRWLSGIVPWPLGTCLAVASCAAELELFAERAASGKLGDLPDWKAAEERWERSGVSLDELVHLPDDFHPYDANIAKHGMPTLPGWITPTFSPEIPVEWIDTVRSFLDSASMKRARGVLTRVLRLSITSLACGGINAGRVPISPDELRSLYELPDEVIELDGLFVLDFQNHSSDAWADVLDHIGRSHYTFTYFPETSVALAPYLSALFCASPERLGILRIIRRLHRARIQFSIPRSLLDPVGRANPDRQIDASLILLAQGDLGAEELEAVARALVAEQSAEDAPIDEALDILENYLVDPLVHGGLLLALWKYAPPSDWLLAGRIATALTGVLRRSPSELENPATWDRLQLPLPRPEIRPKSIPPPPSDRGAVTIDSITIRNIRLLDEVLLPLNSKADEEGQWIVILGENGTGKTTMLRSLVLALTDLSDPARLPRAAFATPWRRSGVDEDTPSDVQVHIRGAKFRTEIRPDGAESERFLQDKASGRPLVFAYGCRRGSALGGSARDVNYEPGAEIATLFDEGANLIHAETWLALRHGAAFEDASGEKQRLFDTILEALKGVLPGVDKIEIRNMRVLVSGPAIHEVSLAALSDGYLTTTGWVLDLIARWVDRAERRGEPIESGFTKTMTGLVLVDEIDLHLHPRWQLRVVSDVRKIFPRMSFVVTTHNPLTLLGAEAEEIWVLRNTEDRRITIERGRESPSLMTGSQIYQSYFGITSLFPNNLGEKLRRYGFLAGSPIRSDDEESEMLRLLAELRAQGVDPGWEPVPRQSLPPFPGDDGEGEG